ncbi:MAG TPA: hypothetical protein PLI18_17740 [Pirellulaceae bacterium]|nr:hypothetical protein [Pirellulaceae bacterium]
MTLYPHEGTEAINVGTSTANATPIKVRRAWGGRILVPNGSALNAKSVKIYERETGGTDWYECLDENDVAIAFTAKQAASRPVPYSLNASHEICLVASTLSDPVPVKLLTVEGQERP